MFSDEHVTAWLICWMEDHDTGFHDHDISCGAVAVVSGCVREERLALDGSGNDRLVRAGESFHFSASDIHRVRHAGSDPAVTLHVYSPPLLSMGAYVVRENGRLRAPDGPRRARSYGHSGVCPRPDRHLAGSPARSCPGPARAPCDNTGSAMYPWPCSSDCS